MYYITGDVHGNAYNLINRCEENNITENDTLIVLGDMGANFHSDIKDILFKKKINNLGTTFFCIHGNHEIRPETIETYKIKEWNLGKVYYEEEFPNILFAIDGEIYNIDDKKTLVIGGAYSVDKYYRAFRAALNVPSFFTSEEFEYLSAMTDLSSSAYTNKAIQKKADRLIEKIPPLLMGWWKDEQPSKKTKELCETKLDEQEWKVDVVLTHTAPLKFEPTEVFIEGLNQDLVDKSTEKWLDDIESKLHYKKWYAGHYHTDKTVQNNFQFLFKSVEKFAELIKDIDLDIEKEIQNR